FLLYGVLVAAPAPLTFAFGQPEFALYFTTGILMFPLPLAVGIWSIRGARQLQAALLALAEEAVARERLRIDGELRETLGARLEESATRGGRAALGREVARLRGETARGSVIIVVTRLDGRARLELRSTADTKKAGVAAG